MTEPLSADQAFIRKLTDIVLDNLHNENFGVGELTRESGLTAGEIGRMVNAGNVLEGSVRRYGDQVRISVQLIDASRDQHLWSANFDSDLTDVIAIQSDIALQVASTLKAVISEKELKAIEEATLYRLEKNLGNEMRLGHYFNLIANNPDFDFLRDNPRFIEVIRQAGLSDYHTRPSQPAREL